jgi:hypothetical protein
MAAQQEGWRRSTREGSGGWVCGDAGETDAMAQGKPRALIPNDTMGKED